MERVKKNHRKKFTNVLTKYQRYNHFPFCWKIHDKTRLYSNYFSLKQKFDKEFNYMPYSFVLPLKREERKQFEEYKFSENNVWIVKSPQRAKGAGINLFQNLTQLPKHGIISKYIENPFLINGLKFDLRIYVLVTGFTPLKLYIYKDGLTRFAGEKYNLTKDSLENRFMHLTNYAVNKKSPNYKKNNKYEKEEGNKWTISTLKKHFENEGINFNKIWEQIEDIVIKTFISFNTLAYSELKKMFITGSNLFELYGFDVLIDSNLKPWLLEVNHCPSLGTGSMLDLIIKTNLITDILNIIGVVPYSHNYAKKSLDPSPTFESIIQENVYEAFCEFERPYGNFKRIFPKKSNIKYYRQFFENDYVVENEVLWKYMKEFNYE